MVNWHYIRGVLWFLLSLLICQCNDAIMKYANFYANPFQITFLRFLFGALWLVLPMLFFGVAPFRTRHAGTHVLRGMVLFGATAGWCIGLGRAPMSTAVVLGFAMPFFLLILSHLLLKERVSRLRWLATAVGFIGVALVAEPWHGGCGWAAIPLLFSGFLFAFGDILNKRLADREGMWSMLFQTALATTFFAAIPLPFIWQPIPLSMWINLAILGAGADLLLFCLIRAMRLIDASATAPYRYVEFLISLLAGHLLFGEVAGIATLLGAATIIPTTLLLACREGRIEISKTAPLGNLP
jgi:S-adenosylmethionine uptake transporter